MNVAVTGASAGIGRATALAFARRGATVGVVARRVEQLEEVARACADVGGRGVVIAADLAEATAVDAAAARIAAELSPLDVLVNNAGMPSGGSLLELDPDQIERVTRLNVGAAARLTRSVLPAMRARGRGAIVNVASIAGRVGVPGAEAYSASKFALAGFSDALALECANAGVAVILVNPGPVHTASFPHARLRNRLFVCEPEDVARAIVRAVDRGRSAEVIVPRLYRLGPVLGAIAPPVLRAVLRRAARLRG